MNEEDVFKLENIITILIGIVIIAFIILLLYNLRKAKRKIIEQETELLKKNKQIRDSYEKESIKKNNTTI